MSTPFRLVAALASSLIATACSSGGFDVAAAADDATSDATSDVAETTVETPIETAADTPAEAAVLECRDAGDCSGGKPICCADFDLGPGALPSCAMSSASTRCASSCPTQIPLACPNHGRVVICRDSADCAADGSNPKCCRIFVSGTIGSACVSELVSHYAISCN